MAEGLPSSPDPLNHSSPLQFAANTRRSSRVRHSLPLRGSSPTKQTFELDIGNQISPQKIRVTVEARKSDTENVASPTRIGVNRRRERTTTTTVPVKGLSDSEYEIQEVATPKKGRGRPRKSTGTPAQATKRGRGDTPTRKNNGRRKSIGDLVDGDDEEDYDFQIGKGVEAGRGKGRPRSNSKKATRGKYTPATKQAESVNGLISSSTNGKGRGRRKTLLPDEFVILEDESSGGTVEPGEAEASENGALEAIDANAIYPPSEYSTIRSTTINGCNERDILIARFDPGNETPRRTGWSSPRVVDARRPSSPIRNLNSYSPPSVSPGMATNRYDNSEDASQGQNTTREYQVEEEDTDGIGEVREFDTILESEGFSMISVDSVPSLREHLSSPTNQGQGQEPANPSRNKNLAFVHAVEAAAQDGSFSRVPADIIEVAIQARKARNQNLLSIQIAPMEDSFSSIPPEILEAASPTRKPQISKLQALKYPHTEDSFSSVAHEILEAATPGIHLPKPKTLQRINDQAYEDSFSAIPSTIFDAATPAPIRQASPELCSIAQRDAAYDRLDVPGPNIPQLVSQQGVISSKITRLLTPEETPSPAPEALSFQESVSDKTSPQVSAVANLEQPGGDDTTINSQIRSSPPSVAPRRYTYTAHFRQKCELYPGLAQTPSIVFSSPSLPPPIHHARGQIVLAATTEPSQRPTLSPIVRAGRVLQDIVVPSSPRGRAHSLGSPFKSPVADRKSSPSVIHSSLSPAQERRPNPLPKLDLAGNLFPEPAQYHIWNRSVGHEDPFSNNAPRQQISPYPGEKQVYTLGLPEERRLADHRLSNIRSETESVQIDDAMSWQAEEEVPANDVVTTSLMNNINSSAGGKRSSAEGSHPSTGINTEILERKWTARRAATSKQICTADASQVVVIDPGDEGPTGAYVGEDDEDFGLLVETLNSSSPAVTQHVDQPKDNIEKPRRSKIPSPWRKNSKRLVYSDELSHLSSPPPTGRAALAEDSATTSVNYDSGTLDLSSWRIPQKSNFKPRVRESGNLDLSALLASSPNKSRLPVLTESSQSNFSVSTDPSFPGSSSCQVSEEDTRESQPQTYSPVPQKLGFKPHVRGVRDVAASSKFALPPIKQPDSYVNNVFGVHSNGSNLSHNSTTEPSSLSAAQPLSASSPSRTNTLRLENPSESECSYDSTLSVASQQEQENHAIENRTFKWTETLHLVSAKMQPFTSPTKSCLRSPLKNPSYDSGIGNNISPSKTVTFVSSSPLPFSPTAEPLSSTTWSRQHWLLLDSILQAWKPDGSGESGDEPNWRRRNSTRVISKLLGKNVFSQGEKMKLQQWHLEVVDEFRGYVPGWEEVVIAKRVFALIVGEERRALGLIGSGRGAEVAY